MMKNKIGIILLLASLTFTNEALATICGTALGNLPREVQSMFSQSSSEKFSVELFIETYEKIILSLEKSDLEQLLISPFDLKHPSNALRHNEAKLLNLMNQKLNLDLRRNEIEDQLRQKIQNQLDILKKYENEARLDSSKSRDQIQSSEVLTVHTAEVDSIVLSPNGSFMASASYDGMLYLWDFKKRKIIKKFGPMTNVFKMAFSPDEKILAIANRNLSSYVQFLNSETGEPVSSLQDDDDSGLILTLAFSPDGTKLAAGTFLGRILVWDLQSPGQPKIEKTNRSSISSLAFSPDSKSLISGEEDEFGSIHLYRSEKLENKTDRFLISSSRFVNFSRTLEFSKDGKYFYSGGVVATINLIQWSAADFKPVGSFHYDGGIIFSIKTSPTGKMYIAGKSKSIKVQDIEKNQFGQLNGHTRSVSSLSLSADGKLLVSGSLDKTIRIWNLKDEE